MLFNSTGFVFGFLPLALAAVWIARRLGRAAALFAALALSLLFYGLSDLRSLPLLLASFVINYALGEMIVRGRAAGRSSLVRALVTAGVVFDVGVLVYFKYLNFVLQSVAGALGTDWSLGRIALPLGVSFFTFQEIAYIVDAGRGETRSTGPLTFGVLFAWFSKIISGPIVRYHELAPQLMSRRGVRVVGRDVLVGLTQFAMGLFKKTVIADPIARPLNVIFGAAHRHGLHPATAWVAVVGFTIQLYFDFSGYSDMALGIARMFGLKLPLNFHSPLRARNIADFWRRWHMTLQRWVVSYIFQPLSLPLNRFAAQRGLTGWSAFLVSTGLPIFVTFVVLGVWHGAGWTYLVFGAMHGCYVAANEAWRERDKRVRRQARRAGRILPPTNRLTVGFYHGLTLLAVLLANVAFRSRDLSDAGRLWMSMAGAGHDLSAPRLPPTLLISLVACALIIFLAPNTQQILGRFDPAQNWREWRDVGRAPLIFTWRPNVFGLMVAALTLFLAVLFIQAGPASFIYFNF